MWPDRADREEYGAFLDQFRTQLGQWQFGHQLLGYPTVIQGDVLVECSLSGSGVAISNEAYHDPANAHLVENRENWRLLFQFDSDDELGVMWGDMGSRYFCLREADLKARRFERCWMMMQCS